MKSKNVRRSLLTIVLAFVIVLGGVVAVPEKASAAVTDTVLKWPTKKTKLSQSFSATNSKVHQGVDIPGTLNDEIYAAEAGTVVSRGNISGGYGNYLVIQHQSGLFTLYGHLNKYASNVEVNKKVSKGQVVAYMGNTGYSTGVHLHFEVRKVKTLYYDSQLSEIQKNLYNPMSFKYVYTNSVPQISNYKVTSITSDGATIECDVTSSVGLQSVRITAWPDGKDYQWLKPVSSSGNHFVFKVNVSDFSNQRGLYKTNIFAWDTNNTQTKVSVSDYTIPQPTVTNNKPIGNIDGVVCDIPGKIHIVGWAFDKDTMGSAVDIHVYVGGPAGQGGVYSGKTTANLERTDVNNVHKCGNYHGFGAQITTSKTGKQDVYIYAIDTNGKDVTFLGSKTVDVSTAIPIGVFEKVESVSSNKIHVVGWAYDPDTQDKTVTVAVYIGGQCGTAGVERHDITANVTRDDVNKAKNCGATHGFDAIITTKKTGNQAIYVWAHNTDGCTANIHTWLGNKNVNIHECNHTKTESAPSCTETLKGEDECSICGKVHSTWNVEPVGHTIVVDPAVAPTYETTGLTEGSHCSVCGAVIVAQEVVPVLQKETVTLGSDEINNAKTDINSTNTSSTQTNNINTSSQKTNSTVKNSKTTKESGDVVTDEVDENNDFTYQIEDDDEVTLCKFNNTELKMIVIPETITYDGEKLEVTAIDDEAFKACKNLTKIVIGKNVEEIGDRAFKGCSKLKNIEIKTTKLTKKKIGKNAFKGISKKAVFKCPKKQLKNYKKWIKKVGAPNQAKFTK